MRQPSVKVLTKTVESLRKQVAETEEQRDAAIENAMRDAEALRRRIAERDDVIALLRANTKEAIVLRDGREIIAWDNAPEDVKSAVTYASRAGCALVLDMRTEQDWTTGAMVVKERLVVTSYRREMPR